MGEVTVVIPVHNGAAFVASAVDSALAQSSAPDRVVVVDDGSTDATADVLARYRERIEVLTQPNRGVAAARNAGAARATSPFLAFLDADDTWLETKLERQLEAFASTPEVGLVHCGVVEVDPTGTELRTRLDGLSGSVAADLVRWERSVVLGGGSAAVLRTELFRSVGGYDERLSTSADWDLFVRAAQVAPIGFVREVLVRYLLHDGNMHRNIELLEHDMTMAMAKAFASSSELAAIERIARGNLHWALSGGYLHQRRIGRAIAHGARAVAHRPALLARLARRGRDRA